MLSFDEHPGIISFLLGIIVLVMAAVGLSLVVDHRLKFSSGSVKAEREIDLGSRELEKLTALCEQRSTFLREAEQKPLAAMKESEEVSRDLKTLSQRHEALEAERDHLRGEQAALEADFSKFRGEYRRKAWAAAIGEKLGDLRIRGGREYKDASITRVTDVGIEIRHADGIARIQAPDLDPDMLDRFQMNDENRRKNLIAEQQRLNAFATEPAVIEPDRPGQSSLAGNTPEPAELAGLRRQVLGWQAKISQLKSQQSQAQSNMRYGNQTSVPGSLETWSARSERLSSELSRAQASLVVAKANLAEIAAHDPLLRTSAFSP